MSQLDWKFLKALPSVTPIYNTILQAGDTALNMLSKLQGLLYKDISTSRTSIFTGTANSTADQDFLTLTIPANRLGAGDFYRCSMWGLERNSGTPDLSFYLKINGAKVAEAIVSPNNSWGNYTGLVGDAVINVLSDGVTGEVTVGSSLFIDIPATNRLLRGIGNPLSSIAVNTTAVVNITLGMSWSNASNNNVFVVTASSIKRDV